MNKHRKHHPDELMGGGQNSHLIAKNAAAYFARESLKGTRSCEIIAWTLMKKQEKFDPGCIA